MTKPPNNTTNSTLPPPNLDLKAGLLPPPKLDLNSGGLLPPPNLNLSGGGGGLLPPPKLDLNSPPPLNLLLNAQASKPKPTTTTPVKKPEETKKPETANRPANKGLALTPDMLQQQLKRMRDKKSGQAEEKPDPKTMMDNISLPKSNIFKKPVVQTGQQLLQQQQEIPKPIIQTPITPKTNPTELEFKKDESNRKQEESTISEEKEVDKLELSSSSYNPEKKPIKSALKKPKDLQSIDTTPKAEQSQKIQIAEPLTKSEVKQPMSIPFLDLKDSAPKIEVPKLDLPETLPKLEVKESRSREDIKETREISKPTMPREEISRPVMRKEEISRPVMPREETRMPVSQQEAISRSAVQKDEKPLPYSAYEMLDEFPIPKVTRLHPENKPANMVQPHAGIPYMQPKSRLQVEKPKPSGMSREEKLTILAKIQQKLNSNSFNSSSSPVELQKSLSGIYCLSCDTNL